MLGNYFYHEIIKKTVTGFGTLFNDIHIRHKDENGTSISDMKVPLAYGPVQKFLARIEQQRNLNKPIQMTLPRMSFEMSSIAYDAGRKAGITQTFKASDGTNLKKVYLPVPYNIGFSLNIMTKLNDDSLQILEQILPYFQPAFNITINLINSIGEKRDIPIVLDSITMKDDYEGDFSERRVLIYTLTFTAKTYMFGPIADTTDGLIKKVQVDTYLGSDIKTSKREVRYTVTPKALQDYNNDNATTLSEDLEDSTTRVVVNNSSGLSINERIIIENEIMFIKSIEGNNLSVIRGYDGTSSTIHLKNSSIDIIDSSDDLLIEDGDDFGFNEVYSSFTDSKDFSPSRNTDI